jgi:hypothetical protein
MSTMQGEQAFRTHVHRLSVNDLWLLQQIVTAFWHTFGIANGLRINPETDLKTVHYREGPDGHYVKAEAMRAKLDEYITWLDRYQQAWGTERYNQVHPAEFLLQELFSPSHSSYRDVVKMLELVQIGNPGHYPLAESGTGTPYPDAVPEKEGGDRTHPSGQEQQGGQRT